MPDPTHTHRTVTINRPETDIRRAWERFPKRSADILESVDFIPSTRGVQVRATAASTTMGGKLGQTVQQLRGEEPGQHLRDDLRQFKMLLETGEIATTEGQPHGEK